MTTFSKMIIMPSDEAERLRDKKILQYNPTIRSLAHLDAEMESILGQKNLDVEEKLTRYQTALMRFGQISNLTSARSSVPAITIIPAVAPAVPPGPVLPPAAPIPPVPIPALPIITAGTGSVTIPVTTSTTSSKLSTRSTAAADSSLFAPAIVAPKLEPDFLQREYPRKKETVNQFLNYINNFPYNISQDSDGQLVLNGETIMGSNYSDLLRDLFATKKSNKHNLTGRPELINELKAVGVDPKLVPNKNVQRQLEGKGLQRGRGGYNRKRKSIIGYVKGSGTKVPGIRPKLLRLYY